MYTWVELGGGRGGRGGMQDEDGGMRARFVRE